MTSVSQADVLEIWFSELEVWVVFGLELLPDCVAKERSASILSTKWPLSVELGLVRGGFWHPQLTEDEEQPPTPFR